MKTFRIGTAIALAIVTTAVFAQSGGMNSMGGMQGKDMDMKSVDMKSPSGKSKSANAKNQRSHRGSGVVKAIDTGAGTVTISHGPIETMNWPAMNMTFAIKDHSLLDALRVGTNVDFDFVNEAKSHVITAIK